MSPWPSSPLPVASRANGPLPAEPLAGLRVVVGDGDLTLALRRFAKLVDQSGRRVEFRRHTQFVSPSELRRLKDLRAAARRGRGARA